MNSFLAKHNGCLTIISTVLMIFIILFTIKLELNEKIIVNKETERFITEWTTFDGKFDSNHIVLSVVNLNKEINIKYMDPLDTIDFIYNDTGILFVGTPDDQSSRVAIENLIDLCLENNIKTINYIDISRYQTEWAVRDGVIKDYVIDDNYSTLLTALDDFLGLDTYKVTIDGINYDTSSKNIKMPNVFAIKNGEVRGNYSGIGRNVDPFNLSGQEQVKLKDNYLELIRLTRSHN